MNNVTFIVNPAAGKGTGKKFVSLLDTYLRRSGVRFVIASTHARGEAKEIAEQCADPYVVAVGGDGTINEVANGLVGTGKTLGIVPAGSGNDFSKSIGIPATFPAAMKKLLEKKTAQIDVGTVVCNGTTGTGNSSARYFVNGIGIGFDAAVAERTTRINYLSGTALYILAVFQTLTRYASPNFELSVDGMTSTSKKLLIAVGNGACVGGGFYLTPEARVDDGLLDVCTIDELPVFGILRIMPRVMKGKHRGMSGVRLYQGKQITVKADAGYFVHADGEIIGRNTQHATIGLLPKALHVIVG